MSVATRATHPLDMNALTRGQKCSLCRRCSHLRGQLLLGGGTRIGRKFGALFDGVCCGGVYPAMQAALDAWEAVPERKRQAALADARFRLERRREDYKLSLMGPKPTQTLIDFALRAQLTDEEQARLAAVKERAVTR